MLGEMFVAYLTVRSLIVNIFLALPVMYLIEGRVGRRENGTEHR